MRKKNQLIIMALWMYCYLFIHQCAWYCTKIKVHQHRL